MPTHRTIIVSNSSELTDALKNAQNGDTIKLESNSTPYNATLSKADERFDFNSTVTITSLDPDTPAVIETLFIKNASNIHIDNVSFQAPDSPRSESWLSDLFIRDSYDITITNSTFEGNATGYAASTSQLETKAFIAENVDNLTFTNNDVGHYGHGVELREVTNSEVSNNHLHHMQGDSVRGYELDTVDIQDNLFTDAYGAAHHVTHSDNIQIWASNTNVATKNVNISGNTFFSEDFAPQNIFIHNELAELPGKSHLRYQNITIEDNVAYNSELHGITINNVDGLTIKNNTLLDSPTALAKDYMEPSINVHNATGARIQNNVVSRMNVDESTVDFIINRDNYIIQDDFKNSDNYVAKLFLNPFQDNNVSLDDLKVNPDGPLVKADGSVFGSQRLIIDSHPDELKALITKDIDPDTNVHTFTAANSANQDGFSDHDDATYLWDFGDGNTDEGFTVTHDYQTPGTYNVTLTMIHQNGVSDITSSKVIVTDPSLANLKFYHHSVEDNSSYDSDVNEIGNTKYRLIENGDYALQLEENSSVEIARENMQLFNLDQFSVEISLRGKNAGSDGYIMSIHNAISLEVTDEGRLALTMTNDAGATSIALSQMTAVNDGNWHNLIVTYNSHASQISFYLDGTNVGNATMTGFTQQQEFWGLILGHHYRPSFDSDIAKFEFRDDTLTAQQVDERYNDYHSTILMGIPVPEDDTYAVTITGDAGANSLNGTIGDDLINGEAGNDRLEGRYGDDSLNGGDGYDRIYGETGHDTIRGGNHNDRLFGDAGNDILFGDDGYDLIYGGTGHDTIYGGLLNDRLYGGGGNDILSGGSSNDRLFGEDGSDILNGGTARDQLFGGGGADRFVFDRNGQDGHFDYVMDFNANEGDVIDIADVLDFSSAAGDDIMEFISVTQRTNYTELNIDQDGSGNAHDSYVAARIYGVTDMDLEAMITNASLIVE